VKPHPRIRKTVKWGGAAVTVLLVVVWIGSGWWTLSWRCSSAIGFTVNSGSFMVRCAKQGGAQGAVNAGWFGGYLESGLRWWVDWDNTPRSWAIFVPLWLPAIAALVVTTLAWRLDTLARRRAKLNLCPTKGCDYDRTGLAIGAACPECGKTP
jgi:hypothetical protein